MLTGKEIHDMYFDALGMAEEITENTIAASEQMVAVVLQAQSEVTSTVLTQSAERMRLQLQALHEVQHRVFGLMHVADPAAVEEILTNMQKELAVAEEKLQPLRAA